ncbi:30S ribosomal protein S2 [Candidatus Vidania fulgoroideorum]
MEKIIKIIKKKNINIGHKNNNFALQKKHTNNKLNICIIKYKKMIYEFKKLLFFLKNFYLKKRVTIFLSTKYQHIKIMKKFSKKINFFFLYKWKRGTLTNDKIKDIKDNVDIIFLFDPLKNISIVNESFKKKIKIVVFGDHYINKNFDFCIPINDDSECSLFFVLNQIYLLLKKIEILKIENKNIYFFNIKNKIIKIKIFSDFFIKKKYFLYKLKNIINFLNRKNIIKIKESIKYISNFYNEKILIKGYKKIKNFFIINKNFVCLSNYNNLNFLIFHVILNIKNIFNNYFNKYFITKNYKNIKEYIKKKKKKNKKIILKILK